MDYQTVLGKMGKGFQLDTSSLFHLRPDLSLPAYAGMMPSDGFAPICNLFDRNGGGEHYTQRVTKKSCVDFRGKRLSYDEHDGIDFVCPIGTKVVAAAPGEAVLVRDKWLRGGLTLTIDHGAGLTTQYTHLTEVKVEIGQKVGRGEVVAISGASGIDMTTFFPWVPPHLHFMSWYNGLPRDPYLKTHELAVTGTWQDRNFPCPGNRNDIDVPESKVNTTLIANIIHDCMSEKIRSEIVELIDKPLSLTALLEDSFHHEAWAWPDNYRFKKLRIIEDEAPLILLSLPLNWNTYKGAYFADLV